MRVDVKAEVNGDLFKKKLLYNDVIYWDEETTNQRGVPRFLWEKSGDDISGLTLDGKISKFL